MSGHYEPIAVWADYFVALDPQERLTVYNETAAEDDPLAAFLARLYDVRYHDPRRPGQSVDTWLWKFVYLPGLYQKRRVSKRAFHTEVERTLSDLLLDKPHTAAERLALYWEYRNAARRFLSTCLGKRYGSRLFGLKEASLAEKKEKASAELWMASRGIARAAGKEQEMSLFCDAVRDELAAFYPNYEEIHKRLEQRFTN